jgi:hypothetical protein
MTMQLDDHHPIRREGAVTFAHGEAYRLMKYVSEADGRVEWLWNSRDGVTPFMIIDNLGCARGLPASKGFRKPVMTHEDWQEDAFVPNFVPPVGMRIFVDGPPDLDGARGPQVVVVDEALRLKFEERAKAKTLRFVNGSFRDGRG